MKIKKSEQDETLGQSGRGVSPLNIRRGSSVKKRIKEFVDKIKKADEEYKPNASDGLTAEFKKRRTAWKKAIQSHVRTEMRWLQGEGMPDTKGKAPKLRANTTQVRLSLYRRAIAKEINELNPEFIIKAREIMADKETSEDLCLIISDILKNKSYTSALKRYHDILLARAENLQHDDYRVLKSFKSLMPHPVIPLLNVTDQVRNLIKSRASKAMKARHTVAVRRIEINVMIAWMERILSNYASYDWKHTAIALALATGRRPIELFRTGDFKVVNSNTVEFSGQAKKKLADSESYEIPVLFDASVCVSAIDHMRNLLALGKRLTNDQVNQKTAKPLADRMQRIFGDDAIEFYGLRAAYARYVLRNFYYAEHGTEEAFLAKILGHEEHDLNSVQHYKTVIFSEETSLSSARTHWEKIAEGYRKEDEEYESKKNKEYKQKINEILSGLRKHDGNLTGTRQTIFDWIKFQLEAGNTRLTQTMIAKEGGFNAATVRSVLGVIGSVCAEDPSKITVQNVVRKV
jgi:hypothetical protein